MAITDPTLRNQYSSRLFNEGFNVANVSDAIECLAALRCRAFDVLVVEMEIPQRRGEHISELMCNDPQIQTPPAVVIEIPGDSTRDPRFSKYSPVAIEELMQAIKSRLRHKAH